MHKLFASDQPLAEPLQQIVLDLSDRSRAHIVLAVADDATLQHEAIAELGERLSGTYALYTFDYAHTTHLSLPRFCRTLRDILPGCVFAYGLEELRKQDREKYDTALHFLNAHREDIYYTRSAVVLWLTSQTHADLSQYAPDFADWRTTDVSFALADGWSVEHTPLGKLPIEEAEYLRNQARRFEEMLARPNLAPPMQAEFQKQLALVRKQLGQDKASENALAASARTSAALSDYQRLEELYCQHIVDRFGTLTLYSVTSDAPLTVDLERVFVKLTVTQRLAMMAGEMSIESRMSDPSPEWRRTKDSSAGAASSRLLSDQETTVTLSVSETLRTYPCLMVIGGPGTGKTTLLQYIALTFARQQALERLGWDEKRLPIFIALRDFNRFLDNLDKRGEFGDLSPHLLPRFLNEHVKAIAPYLPLPTDFFRRMLESGRCMVLLDGLDEVADPLKRGRVAEAIAAFASYDHYRRNRFIITARPRGYEEEAKQRLAPFCTDCTIRDFDDNDMTEFVHSWYKAVTRDRLGDNPDARGEAQRQANDLLRAIRADVRVQALARNPLLLSVLAMVHQRGVGLPQRRTELYDECTDMLLGYWDQTKGGEAARELAAYGVLNRSEKRTLLAPIALWFHEHGAQGSEVDKEALVRETARQFVESFGADGPMARRNAERFLRIMNERTGLLVDVEPGTSVYAFAHLTFQEYLAACAIADRDDYIDYTLQRLHDPWWREVILLEVGHLSEVRHFGRRARRLTTDLMRAIRDAGAREKAVCERNLLFAARAIVDIGPLGVDDTLRQDLINTLFALWKTTPDESIQEEMADIFGYAMPTGDGVRIEAALLRCLEGEDRSLQMKTLQALRQMGAVAATTAMLERVLALSGDADASVREAAVWAMEGMGEAAATASVLERLVALLGDSNSNVRQAAAQAVVRMGKGAATATVLEGLVGLLSRPAAKIRQTAVWVVGELGEAAATVAILERLVALLGDPNSNVRQVVERAVEKMGEAAVTATVLTRLENLLDNSNPKVRQTAARVAGRLGEAAATTAVLAQLENLLSDPVDSVRKEAVRAVGRMGKAAETTAIGDRLTALVRYPIISVSQEARKVLESWLRRWRRVKSGV